MSTEPQTTIQITLNGEARQIPASLTINGLFELFQLSPEAIIVERNQTVVPRSTFATLTLEPGDRIELMRLIGGG